MLQDIKNIKATDFVSIHENVDYVSLNELLIIANEKNVVIADDLSKQISKIDLHKLVESTFDCEKLNIIKDLIKYPTLSAAEESMAIKQGK